MSHQKKQKTAKKRGSHSRIPISPTREADKKINLVIQLRGNKEHEILKVRVSNKTKLGEITKYLENKYGETSNTLYMAQINPESNKKLKAKVPRSSSQQVTRRRVDIVFKNSIGDNQSEAKLRVPKDIHIKTLKDALASRFGLSSEDFELIHINQT